MFSQKQNNTYITTVDISVYSPNFDKVEDILKKFFKKTSASTVFLKNTQSKITTQFYIDKKYKTSFDSIAKVIGYVHQAEVKTTNYGTQQDRVNIDIQYYKNRKDVYEKEIELRKQKNEKYDEYWHEVRRIEATLFNLQKDINALKKEHNYIITLTIYDDNVDLTKRRIKWVNMPGVSFDMLWVENPTLGISQKLYQGFSLKYMFTRGKSYAKLGALKAVTKDTLPTYTELFQFSFGQDYYTKHFGRGKRKFLNLYSGYDIGGAFATGSDIKNKFLPFLKIHLGVELFKGKRILLDNKVSYFVPFAYNREFRGLAYSASFNFVF